MTNRASYTQESRAIAKKRAMPQSFWCCSPTLLKASVGYVSAADSVRLSSLKFYWKVQYNPQRPFRSSYVVGFGSGKGITGTDD